MPDTTDTRDLRDRGLPHPAEKDLDPRYRETSIRRFGKWSFRAGISLGVLAVIGCLAATSASAAVYAQPVHRMFIMLAVQAVVGMSSALIAVGGVEWLTRPLRAANRLQLEQVREAAATAQAAADLTAPVYDQLEVIETHLSDRLTAMAAALDAIAEHIPQAKDAAHWQGFNAAVREGLTDQRTGTDGVGGNRKRLGVVPPRQDD